MKHEPQPRQQSLQDDYAVRRLVSPDHPLLVIDRAVDFEFVHDLVAGLYSEVVGRRAVNPALLMRLCFLQAYYGLSDREVIERSQTDLALRAFLHLDLEDELPHPTTLTVFRRRLGQERFKEVFNRSVAMAVERGLVGRRMMLADSYGIIADLAVPRLRRLLMRLSRRGLRVLESFGLGDEELRREEAAMERDESWWLTRKHGERDIERWFVLAQVVQEALAGAKVSPEHEEKRRRMVDLLGRAMKRQKKRAAGERRDTLVSDVDADARWSMRQRGKKAYVGYKEQLATDGAHEIITAAAVTPANVDDKEMLAELVEQHTENTGEAPEAVAADSGYSSGPNRGRLKEEEITDYVAVPTPKGHKQDQLSASDFEADFEADAAVRVRCPAGREAVRGKWDEQRGGWTFYFIKAQCEGCELRDRCNKSKGGRAVFISRYWRETADARARQRQPEFLAAQEKRLDIERTFAYQQRRGKHRRAKYRGLAGVGIQVYLSCFMVNVVRIAKAVAASGGPGLGAICPDG